jgi:hypothetical protein
MVIMLSVVMMGSIFLLLCLVVWRKSHTFAADFWLNMELIVVRWYFLPILPTDNFFKKFYYFLRNKIKSRTFASHLGSDEPKV